ncbi:mitochondrial import receptor subunit TOM6 homolog [Ranitomeya imitator]|uniref:mitochondrial import receptor subunit TOM6 homolog n=1 Tax=Ranitomeya imitator TaxID=111125 RepID=UPI0037E6FD52
MQEGEEVTCRAQAHCGDMQLQPEVVGDQVMMAPGGAEISASGRGWVRGAYKFMTDRNDFRRNLLVNLGLFVAGVWAARNMFDIDLMAPQPGL